MTLLPNANCHTVFSLGRRSFMVTHCQNGCLLISNSLKALLIPSPTLPIHPLTIEANILCGTLLSTLYHPFLNLFCLYCPLELLLLRLQLMIHFVPICQINRSLFHVTSLGYYLTPSISTKHCLLVFFTSL